MNRLGIFSEFKTENWADWIKRKVFIWIELLFSFVLHARTLWRFAHTIHKMSNIINVIFTPTINQQNPAQTVTFNS